MNNPPVVCRYSNIAGQWLASFNGSPSVSFAADFSMRAVCRLLEGTGTEPGAIVLHFDQDKAGSDVLTYDALWAPPDLLFLCERCNGKGEYVGLMEVEPCQPCGGRGWLVG